MTCLVGDYVNNIDSGVIDVVVIGPINLQTLNELVNKAYIMVKRRIKVSLLFSEQLSDKG